MEKFLFVVKLILFLTIFPITESYNQWIESNGPFGGMVNVLTAAPSSGETGTNIFAGTAGKGVFRSTDFGAHWEQITEGLGNGFVRSFMVLSSGSTGNRIFAGTSLGVYYTTNEGDSWNSLSPEFSDHGIPAMAGYVDSKGDTVIIVGTDIGLYCSVNNGVSWNGPAHTGIYSGPVMDLAAAPSCDSTGIINLYAGLAVGYLFRSTDNGSSWNPISPQLPGSAFKLLGVSGNKLFASGSNWIFKSTDNGSTWDTASGWSMGTNKTFAVGPVINGDTMLFAAGNYPGIMLSTDNGDNWSRADSGLAAMYILSIAAASGPVQNLRLFAATEGGVLFSADSGKTWQYTNDGLSGCLVKALISFNDGILAGTIGNGIFRSTDSGITWNSVTSGISALRIYSFFETNDILFAGAGDAMTGEPRKGYAGIFRSTDNGINWTDVSNYWTNQSIHCFTRLGSNLYAGAAAYGVFCSTDSGITWNEGINNWQNGPVIALTVYDSIIFAGTTINGILYSTDEGTTWIHSDFEGVYSLFSFDHVIYTGPMDGGAYASADSGKSWYPDGLEGLDVYTFAANNGNLFAGTSSGVFLRNNSTKEWIDVSQPGMPFEIRALATDTQSLFLGSGQGSVVWKRPLREMISSVGTSAAYVPGKFILEQNYPNPFNPATVIEYQIPGEDFVSLKVYDILGKEVATLINGVKRAGSYRFEFNAASLPSGVYFYRISTGNYTAVKKMLLLR